jgi:beta-phosphoglucomutase-like phosphatase (HAD superfamily)
MVQAVVFDVDGTLVDSVDLHARAWREALAHFGVEVSCEEVRVQIGKGADQLLPALVPAERLEEVAGPLATFRSRLFREAYLPQVSAFPAVRRLVARLRGHGKRIAFASSSTEDELAHYLRVAAIDDLVDSATSAGDALRTKPYRDVLEAALARLGEPPRSACCVVGDTPYDATAAVRAGMVPVGVLCGGFPEELLRRAGCAAIHRDPAALLVAYERDGDAALGEVGVPEELSDAS